MMALSDRVHILIDRAFVVIVLGGLTAWIVWGWSSWKRGQPRGRSLGATCSLIAFALASLSASLEIGMGVYAQFIPGGFRFEDPTLLRIYRLGFLSAILGLLCAILGITSKSPLRWKGPLLSTCMALLWMMQAMGE